MSDGTVIVVGLINFAGVVVGFLTVRARLQSAKTAAEQAAAKAEHAAAKVVIVEEKLDDNTATTRDVNRKADTIVEQTNGSLDELRKLVKGIAERVVALETYNHDSARKLYEAINNVHLDLLIIQGRKSKQNPDAKAEESS